MKDIPNGPKQLQLIYRTFKAFRPDLVPFLNTFGSICFCLVFNRERFSRDNVLINFDESLFRLVAYAPFSRLPAKCLNWFWQGFVEKYPKVSKTVETNSS